MAYFRRKKIIIPSSTAKNLKYAKPIGILLPFNEPNGIFKLAYTNEEQVYSNLKNLLLTAKGERYMLPTFGTEIQTILFENIASEESFFKNLENTIQSAIEEWMPYITISQLEISLAEDQDDQKEHAVKISLGVNITQTGIYLPIEIFIDETGNLNFVEAIYNG